MRRAVGRRPFVDIVVERAFGADERGFRRECYQLRARRTPVVEDALRILRAVDERAD